eukprot:CAMPEP_0174855762 /NCGR_PEP_ID=MMETSP1114-20130205/34142_1 /TAXON_ID=312471 /ORGANISM="Neobodo designis, Strain CCAP 1951/1" /LENGTH=572 /DNA_ID=CAMNT_0016090527 /DNA_START=38 /DNA_END=1752 /DNA_ORIENTATION=+
MSALRRPQSAVAASRKGRDASGTSRPSTAHHSNDVEALKRRYRQLEANHRDWQEQVQKDLRRQKSEIDSLRRDNEPLKQQVNELRAAEATAAGASGGASLRGPNSRGMRSHRELEAKRDTVGHLQQRLKDQTQRVSAIDDAISAVRTNLRARRRQRGTVNVTKETHDTIGKQVEVLENRLDQSLMRFNEVLRRNKELRDQIDTLRGEREVFDEIYLKLEADLQDKKKEMAFIIEVSNIAYEERDNNVQVLRNLKAFAAEEMNSFAETFKELDELLEEDRKMKEQVKARLAALEKKDRLGDETSSSRKPQLASKQGGANAESDALSEDAAATQVKQYEDAFNKIRQVTPINDLDGIVNQFLKSEEANYSLFSYVNDLGREIEALEEQRRQHLDQIDAVTLGSDADKDRRNALRQLEEKLRDEEQKGQALSDQCVRAESILRSIMTTVEQLFTRLDCDEKAVVEKHGVAGLTLETVLLYMAGIETRTDEYLTAWCRQNGMLESAGPLRGPQVPYDAMQVTIDPKRLPGTGEESDGSNDDSHPLTHEELLRKAQRKLQGQQAKERHLRGKKAHGT